MTEIQSRIFDKIGKVLHGGFTVVTNGRQKPAYWPETPEIRILVSHKLYGILVMQATPQQDVIRIDPKKDGGMGITFAGYQISRSDQLKDEEFEITVVMS